MKQQAFETTSITQGIVAFSQFARSHGLNIGLMETREALEAANIGLLSERKHFKAALQSIWCKSPEEAMVFEKLFLLFWETNPIDLQKKKNEVRVQGLVEKKTNASLVMLGKGKTKETGTEAKEVTGANETERLKQTDLAKIGEMDAEQLEELSKKLFREMAVRMRRRLKNSNRCAKINLRRTIRKSLSYGGEPMELLRQAKKPKKQRLIVLLDVSGSMDKYSHYLLRFVCALRQHFRQLEAYIFSTKLTKVTRALKQNRLELVLESIGSQADSWSGGTRIGECFEIFREKYGKQLLNGSPTLVVLSDGLDTGNPEILERSIRAISLRCKRVIWLNPLKGMKGYEPLARGMKAALPSIDSFRPAHNLQSLLELEKLLQNV